MRNAFSWLLAGSLAAVSMVSCTKKEANEISPSKASVRSLSVSPVFGTDPAGNAGDNAMGPVQNQYFSAVDVMDGTGRIVYIRTAATEPSGGNKLYWYQDTGVSTAFNYIPSPGAISVAEIENYFAGRSPLMIVDANNDIYYENGQNNWITFPTGGIKFSKIATRDYSVNFTYPTSGMLYGISTDKHIYRFTTSNTWQLTSATQLANDITIDEGGHPWIVGPNHTQEDNVYRAGGYGQAFGGWVPCAGYGTKITASFYQPGITVAAPREDGFSGNSTLPSNDIYWTPLPTGRTLTTNFQLAYSFPIPNGATAPPSIVGITSLKSDKLWIATGPTSYGQVASAPVLYAADFTGL